MIGICLPSNFISGPVRYCTSSSQCSRSCSCQSGICMPNNNPPNPTPYPYPYPNPTPYPTPIPPANTCNQFTNCGAGYTCQQGYCVQINPNPTPGPVIRYCNQYTNCGFAYTCGVNGYCVPLVTPTPVPSTRCPDTPCQSGSECVNGICQVMSVGNACSTAANCNAN